MADLLSISKGNTKTGAIPSFSLSPGVTCSAQACATCYRQGCYARKIERLRPSVAAAWGRNTTFCKENLPFVESYLDAYFSSPNAPRLFRVHVSGDFFSEDYFAMWMRIADAHPQVRFLAFTKQVEIVRRNFHLIPANFQVVLSAWPGAPIHETLCKILPVAWVDDGNETRIPDDAVRCPGHCDSCARCWALDGRDVVFKKH